MAKKDEQPIRCSFCGRRENQAGRLIAGPGVYICNECVQACSELLRDDIEFDEQGNILPVKITFEGVKKAKL